MSEEIQEIDELQQRYDNLNVKKIEAANNLEHAKAALEKHRLEATEKYGTSDIEELRRMLEEMITQNDIKKKNYQDCLDEIEHRLQGVENRANPT